MDSFSIVCATCQSRIRVRNAELIDQLVNCPKCNSIVLVARPGRLDEVENRTSENREDVSLDHGPSKHESPALTGPTADSKAMTKDAIDPDSLGVLNDSQHVTADDLRLLPLDDPLLSSHSHSVAPSAEGYWTPSSEASSAGTGDGMRQENWQSAGRAAPDESWTSTSTHRRRQMLLVAFLGLGSLVLTGILFFLLLSWYKTPTELADHSAPPDGALAMPDAEETDGLPQVDAGNDAGGPADNPVDAGPSQPDQSPAPVEESAPWAQTPDQDAGASMQDRPSNELDADQPSAEGTQGEVETSDANLPPTTLPKHLQELARIIGEPFEFSNPESLVVPERAPVTAEELGLKATVNKAIPPVDLHAISSVRRIRGLRLDDVPLAHAVSYLSLASGVPIWVDDFTLSAANYDRRRRVSWKIDDGTVMEAVKDFSEQAGLQMQPIENRYFRLFAPPPDAAQLPWQIPVDDLVKNDQDGEWLQKTLGTFFPEFANSISYESGKLTANNQQLEWPQWFSVVRLLESWRGALNLPSPLSEYATTALRSSFVRGQQIRALELPLKQFTSATTPLANLLPSACREAGLDCWIDWPSLGTLGLAPTTPVLSITGNRPLRNLLLELEFEHGLAVAVVDETTLWVTSPQSYRQATAFFVLPSEGRELDYWHQYFRPLTPIYDGSASQLTIEKTPDGKHTLVRSCYPGLSF